MTGYVICATYILCRNTVRCAGASAPSSKNKAKRRIKYLKIKLRKVMGSVH
jgi:hypothetical protein